MVKQSTPENEGKYMLFVAILYQACTKGIMRLHGGIPQDLVHNRVLMPTAFRPYSLLDPSVNQTFLHSKVKHKTYKS